MSTTQRPESTPASINNQTTEALTPKLNGADQVTSFTSVETSSLSGPANKPARTGLKLKLTLLAIAMGVLPVLGVGVTVHNLVNRSITEMTETSSSPTAQVEADQLKRSLFLTLLWGTGLSAVAVGIIAAALANRSSRRLQAAIAALEKLSQGDVNVAVAEDGDDESGIL